MPNKVGRPKTKYGFQFHIWSTCYNNGVFSHNAQRTITIDAETEKEAEAQLELRPEGSYESHSWSAEFIYRTENLGKVKYHRVKEYLK